MLSKLQQIVRWFFMRAENLFNLAFGEKLNPFYHLGTISFWQFWLLIGTGSTSTSSPTPGCMMPTNRSSASPTTSGGPAASCAASIATPPTA
jgi:hypothetical protein